MPEVKTTDGSVWTVERGSGTLAPLPDERARCTKRLEEKCACELNPEERAEMGILTNCPTCPWSGET
jgi:hypothetical protein